MEKSSATSPEIFFSEDYSRARARFIAAGMANGADLFSFENAGVKGANGESLFTDVARIGPPNAARLLVIGSGTHGVEGFSGSACQLGILKSQLFKKLPPDTALLLVHALNPYGFSHARRVNENNVDLNRNFIRFEKPLPKNPAYDALHQCICPNDWYGRQRAAADAGIAAFIKEQGERTFQAAISQGQYTHPDGVFFGGTSATWSNRNWQGIVSAYCASAETIVFIDIHTGLGPYGHGELIFIDSSGDKESDLARSWYGDELISIGRGKSVSAAIEGPVSNAFRWCAPAARFMAIAVEFGTYPIDRVINALRAENWLNFSDKASPSQRDDIKAEIRQMFNVAESDWRRMVWERVHYVLTQAFTGLANHDVQSPPQDMLPAGADK